MLKEMTEEPKAIGSPPAAFQIAIETLRSSGARRILDCPAGEGLFVKMLIESGFEEVACCDICPEQFKVPQIKCDFADLNEGLPYDNDRFDALTCLNGLQRVWARGRAVREMARVVKPGGRIIISFPNNADLRRRLLFLMTGSVTWNVIGPPQVALPEARNPAAWYRYPMTLANVLSAMESVGLELEAVRATHYAGANLLLLPIAPLPMAAAIVASGRHKRWYYLRESASRAALFGAFLVVIAKKPIQ